MKRIFKEFAHDYSTYSFGYTQNCVREEGDSIPEIYAQGFLPRSNDEDSRQIFYMARSTRVPLDSFSLSSENRRILKKFVDKLVRKESSVQDFNTKDKHFRKLCLEYFTKRHGERVMSEERFDRILKSKSLTHIVSYSMDDNDVAYVFKVSAEDVEHFWFSFYDMKFAKDSLGLWLMTDCVLKAKEQGKKYMYLGTLYGEKALYKTAFENIEHWDGERWVGDKKALKALARSDEVRSISKADRAHPDFS